MSWYRNPKLATTGIVFVSIAACQTLQIILFVMLSAATSRYPDLSPGIISTLTLLPAVLATVAGGAFLGRLRHEINWFLWAGTAVAVGILPLIVQMIVQPETTQWLTTPSLWISTLGNIVLWIAGCWLGSTSVRLRPDPKFDTGLVRWTTGIVILIIALYGFTWGSIVFSQGYRLARKVTLVIPPDVDELEVPYRDPGIAQARRFGKTVPAGDLSIQSFYIELMKQDRWIDVTPVFQDWPQGQWQTRQETFNGETVEYKIAGVHWQDISGKVLVTLVTQAEKVEPTLDWNESDWKVHGVILSRAYAEPETPMQNPGQESSTNPTTDPTTDPTTNSTTDPATESTIESTLPTAESILYPTIEPASGQSVDHSADPAGSGRDGQEAIQ